MVALADILREREVLSVDPEYGYIVTREKPTQLALLTEVDFTELGTTGQTNYGSFWQDEYNPKLRGLQGLKVYDQMRRSDGQVRQSLLLLKTPVIAGRWYVQAASTSTRDRNVADFVWRCFTEFMTISFNQMLYESLKCLDFGFWVWEKVYDIRVVDGIPRIVWKKFAPRHPLQITEFDYDEHGGPRGIKMMRETANSATEVYIPIDKLVIVTWDREGGNVQGTSVLRGAYKHWYFKDNLYKIDAIQKERHGIGVPIIKLPPNFSKNDAKLANEIGRNLRVNEKAHVVLPPMWELEFAKLEGQPVDAITSIEHHNRMILANVLGEFTQGQGDTAVFNDLFLKSARFVGDTIADCFNQWAIRQLVDFNYSRVGYPELKVRRVGETTDHRTLSFALRNYVGADLIRADLPLENWLREETDLPLYDEETDRKIEQLKLQAEMQERQFEQQQQLQRESNAGQVAGGNKKSSKDNKPPQRRNTTGSARVGGPSNNSAGS